jgi:hypothetical protein
MVRRSRARDGGGKAHKNPAGWTCGDHGIVLMELTAGQRGDEKFDAIDGGGGSRDFDIRPPWFFSSPMI